MSTKSTTCFNKSDQPLTEYLTREEAEAGAEFVAARYGNQMIPYECSKCRNWHLSPPERHTQSRKSDCKDSRGEYKNSYPTEADAQRRANILIREKGISLRVYNCMHCHDWHLTSCD